MSFSDPYIFGVALGQILPARSKITYWSVMEHWEKSTHFSFKCPKYE